MTQYGACIWNEEGKISEGEATNVKERKNYGACIWNEEKGEITDGLSY